MFNRCKALSLCMAGRVQDKKWIEQDAVHCSLLYAAPRQLHICFCLLQTVVYTFPWSSQPPGSARLAAGITVWLDLIWLLTAQLWISSACYLCLCCHKL